MVLVPGRLWNWVRNGVSVSAGARPAPPRKWRYAVIDAVHVPAVAASPEQKTTPMGILEISRFGFFKALQPDSTHWIRWGSSLTADEPQRPDAFGFSALADILWRIRHKAYDLIVLPAMQPDHRFDEPP